MARINKSRYAILGILSKRPCSGYDIRRIFEKISSFYWSESNAQIYPLLKQLKKEKLVTSEIDKESGKRQRCVYQLTKAGKEELKNWLLQPPELQKYREEMLLKLACAHNIPISETIKHIEEFRETITAKNKFLNTVQEHIASEHKNDPAQPYLFMTYHYYDLIFEAKLKWCNDTIADLEKLKKV